MIDSTPLQKIAHSNPIAGRSSVSTKSANIGLILNPPMILLFSSDKEQPFIDGKLEVVPYSTL